MSRQCQMGVAWRRAPHRTSPRHQRPRLAKRQAVQGSSVRTQQLRQAQLAAAHPEEAGGAGAVQGPTRHRHGTEHEGCREVCRWRGAPPLRACGVVKQTRL